jgi:hypothetical protein
LWVGIGIGNGVGNGNSIMLLFVLKSVITHQLIIIIISSST